MNSSLEKLFEKYELLEKDKHEIRQIFSLLNLEKRQRLIDNFDKVFSSVIKLKRTMFIDQNNIYNKTLKNIDKKINNLDVKKEFVKK